MSPRIIIVCLLLVSFAARADEEIAEFPYLVYIAKSVVPGTDAARDACLREQTPLPPAYLPCQPDPHEDICRWISQTVKKKTASLEERLKPLVSGLHDAKENAWRQAVQALGPIPESGSPLFAQNHLAYLDYVKATYQKSSAPVIEAFKSKLETERPKVESTISNIRDAMIEMASNSTRFGPYKALLKKFLNCPLKLKISAGKTDDNAKMSADFGTGRFVDKLLKKTASGQDVMLSTARLTTHDAAWRSENVINPLEEEGVPDCELTLNPEAWLMCSDGNPECYDTIFHEFGHVLNSCHFLQLADIAQDQEDLIARKENQQSQDTKTKMTALDFLKRQSAGLAHRLIEATSCLSLTSDPKFPILNTCKPLSKRSEYEKRCAQEVTGYESQWDEAEADFWAASGLAWWLEKTVPSYQARVKFMYEVWAQSCDAQKARHTRPGYAADVVASVREMNAGESNLPEPLPMRICENSYSQAPLPPAWLGTDRQGYRLDATHQADAVRTNRNYLRNSDLRRALGCPVNDPRILKTCSPVNP